MEMPGRSIYTASQSPRPGGVHDEEIRGKRRREMKQAIRRHEDEIRLDPNRLPEDVKHDTRTDAVEDRLVDSGAG